MKAIKLENVGPIERLSIPIPDEGGVVVLRGRNGAGKSYGLAGVDALVRPSTRNQLRPNDAADKGVVDGCGVTVRLGRNNTARGELECQTLDAACDPSVLVDPGIKDPEAADRKRLETLIRLLHVHVTAADFAAIFTGRDEFRDCIDLTALAGDDPVVSADRIRRRLHDLALQSERLGTSSDQEAEALLRAVADVDTSLPSDDQQLRASMDAATEAVIVAKQQRAAAEKARQVAQQARQRLADAERTAGGPLLAEAVARVSAATAGVQAAQATVRQAEDLLRQAQAAAKQADSELRAAVAAKGAAESYERVTAEWRAQIEAGVPEAPDDARLFELERSKAAASVAVDRGHHVRAALRAHAQAEQIKGQASEHSARAERLRELARSTDSVLESALSRAGVTDVRVSGGRLCVASARRGGMEPVSELSHGERWALALDLAARGMGRGGLLTVEQEAWESLDPDNREMVAGLAKARGLVIVTAEAAAGELRAEQYDPDDAGEAA